MMFMLLTIAIAVIVVLFLLLPLFSRKTSEAPVQRDAVNVEVAVTHLFELNQELESGQISEEQFQRYRLELETVALEDLQNTGSMPEQSQTGNTVLAIIIALVVPLLSLAVYQQIGSQQALSGESTTQLENTVHSQEELEEFLKSVEQDVEQNPDNVESRIALGQLYVELKRYSDAAVVYRELYRLRPKDVDILVDYAEALGLFHGNRLTGRPGELLDEALSIEPTNGRALWLAGFAALQSGDNAQSLSHWRRLLVGLEPDSEVYRQIDKLINEISSSETSSDQDTATQVEAVKQSITVNVSIAPDLKAAIDPDTTLFVFARAAQGPPMPLAVHRGKAGDLPLTVTLDDSMAMMPEMSLSSFPKIIVGVRLSSNGQPQGQSGDYEGYSDTIEVSKTPVVDVIVNSVKP